MAASVMASSRGFRLLAARAPRMFGDTAGRERRGGRECMNRERADDREKKGRDSKRAQQR